MKRVRQPLRKKQEQLNKKVSKPSKNEKNPEKTSHDSDSEDSDEDAGINVQGSVEKEREEFTFEFNDMKPEYDEGICTILKNSIFPNPTEAYNAAERISVQGLVGTSVVCEGSNDTFGFATILPLHNLKVNPTHSTSLQRVIDHLHQSLTTSLSSKSARPSEEFRTILSLLNPLDEGESSKTGLFLHRRFSNFPLELIPHLHRNLIDDFQWAKNQSDKSSDSDVDPEEARDFSQIKHILLLNTCQLEKGMSHSLTEQAVIDVTGNNSVIYDHFEDEIYSQNSEIACAFRPPNCPPFVVMLLSLKSLKASLPEIERMCG